MRIGDLDYLQNSKQTTGQNEDKTVEIPDILMLSEKQKSWKNWWYYYKWYVICGIILSGIIINIIGSRLGLWTTTPDLQIAYIGKEQLPSDTVSAIEQAFTSLASDFNKDGKIIVKVNQYIYGIKSDDPETSYYEYASEITLIGDISNCESYFFLMDDPEQFQRNFQLLARPDGTCPADTDYSPEDKVILWADCPLLSEMDLGTYSTFVLGKEIAGNNQELLSGLFIGRRCFFTETVTKHARECSDLWDALYTNF